MLTAIKFLRADYAQYVIWHLSHTAPAVRANPANRFKRLMKIDIEALSDALSNLMWGYARYGWLDKLPEVISRLEPSIDDPRWRAKIAYHRGIWALWKQDRDGAIEAIKGLQPITAAGDDVDILQLHLDVHREVIGMSEHRAICRRICELTTSVSDKLQYGGASAFQLIMANDPDGARAAFDEVIAEARRMEADDSFSLVADTWFCKVLEGRATITGERDLYNEIDERLNKHLADANYDPGTRALLLRGIGDARRYAGSFREAASAYRDGQAGGLAPEMGIFEAECELRLENEDEAFRLIRAVDVTKLTVAERADHAFTYFYIALKRRDRPSLLEARDLLRNAVTPEPFFNGQRLEHLLTIGDALEAIEKHEATPELGPILSKLRALSRYVQLQPNWNGVGIDGNAIIEDLVARAEEAQKREARDRPTYDGYDLPASEP